MYEIIFDKKAVENLNKIEYKTKEKPFRYFEKLTQRDEYKLRVGSYRVVADIDSNLKKIKIRIIMHRKNIYKKY
jgi:mRNA-degrading endonuclease RelE of RelBE toxin-antitoxin system